MLASAKPPTGLEPATCDPKTTALIPLSYGGMTHASPSRLPSFTRFAYSGLREEVVDHGLPDAISRCPRVTSEVGCFDHPLVRLSNSQENRADENFEVYHSRSGHNAQPAVFRRYASPPPSSYFNGDRFNRPLKPRPGLGHGLGA